MKQLPNILSVIRMILSIILLFLPIQSSAFLLLYLICGISDVLDGAIARRWHLESALGARLDSAADTVFFLVLVVKLLPLIPGGLILWIAGIAAIRCASIYVEYVKYKKPVSLHTWGNKLTGLYLFFVPILMHWVSLWVLTLIGCVLASLSAMEELLIAWTSKELDLNCKGFFF